MGMERERATLQSFRQELNAGGRKSSGNPWNPTVPRTANVGQRSPLAILMASWRMATPSCAADSAGRSRIAPFSASMTTGSRFSRSTRARSRSNSEAVPAWKKDSTYLKCSSATRRLSTAIRWRRRARAAVR